MPAASIEVVCTPAEEQAYKVATDPWRYYDDDQYLQENMISRFAVSDLPVMS